MELKDIVAVSEMPGLYKMVTPRNNGLVIEDFDTGKRKFAPMRKHSFTPMESVAIYTMTDTIEIGTVFKRMLEQIEDNPVISPKSSSAEIMEYFADIVPDYDEDKVFTNDVKKVIKWFNFLHQRNLLPSESDGSDEEE